MQQLNLSPYRINTYSQFGEDGVIEKLLELTNTKTGWLVEFGAWDGIHFSNTHYHAQKNPNFKTCLIEGDEQRFNQILKHFPQTDKSIILNLYVDVAGQNSLNNIFEQYNITDIALLSIDVDGKDLEIWNSLDKTKFRPKFIIIEEGKWANKEHLNYFVDCFSGWRLICVTANFIFVRDDLGMATQNNVHELMQLGGHPEFAVNQGTMTKADADWYFDRLKNGEKDIYTKLAKEQIITYGL